MPYASVDSLPAHVKKYSDKIKRQWMHVFNTVYKKTNSEVRAFRAANSVLKKRYVGKEQNWDKNESDYLSYLQDSWLGNLPG